MVKRRPTRVWSIRLTRCRNQPSPACRDETLKSAGDERWCLSQATMSSKSMAPPHVPIWCRGSIKLYNDRPGGCREILKVNGSSAGLHHRHHRTRSTAANLSSDIRGRQWILKADDHAIEVSVGGQIAVKMPARFARYDWQHHQPEAVAAVVQWGRQNPAGVVLDIGRVGGPFEFGDCAGIYSLIALAAGPQIDVVTFDSDLPASLEYVAFATTLKVVDCGSFTGLSGARPPR